MIHSADQNLSRDKDYQKTKLAINDHILKQRLTWLQEQTFVGISRQPDVVKIADHKLQIIGPDGTLRYIPVPFLGVNSDHIEKNLQSELAALKYKVLKR